MDRLMSIMTGLSIALIILVLFSVRRAHIRVEYSVSWLGASFTLLLLSLSHPLMEWLARLMGVDSPPMALLLIVGCLFILVFYRFSVIISDLKDANISLAQRLAILEYRLRSRDEEQTPGRNV